MNPRKILTKTSDLSDFLLGQPRRFIYDRKRKNSVKITPGHQALSADVAVLLIYQPQQLCASLFVQLNHLRDRGVSAIIVANHPINPEEIERLQPFCAAVIERPNIGYDFAGYREGVLHVLHQPVMPENLFILNDSFWMPGDPTHDLIDIARQSDADLFGVFFNDKSRSTPIHYLESYFYRFGKGVLKDPRFQRYWTRMPIYTSKRLVVKAFEFRLTPTFKAMGFTVGSLYTAADVQAVLEKLPEDDLLEVAEYYSDPFFQAEKALAPLLQKSRTSDVSASELRNALLDSGLKYSFIDAHPAVLAGQLKSPVIKKNREARFVRQRAIMVGDGYLDGFDAEIRQEIEGRDD